MTPMEYLIFCGDIVGMEKKSIQQRAEELLSLVGLADERHRIKGFSRGMKQRLGIAQALLHEPKLLICYVLLVLWNHDNFPDDSIFHLVKRFRNRVTWLWWLCCHHVHAGIYIKNQGLSPIKAHGWYVPTYISL